MAQTVESQPNSNSAPISLPWLVAWCNILVTWYQRYLSMAMGQATVVM